ncbi:MAG: ATP-binding protein [Halobacteriota archaeon]
MNFKFDYDTHFDPNKLDRFLRLAGISKVLDTPFILINPGVAEKQEGKVIFNNAGILFFAKNLQDIYYHTAVTCALYKGTEKIEVLDRRDFNEDLISNIDGAMIFLMRYLAVQYEMTGEPRRKEIPEVPYDALREAIINAVAHRDYFEKGANVMVEMFDDRIEITNFGGLVKGLKPADFGKKSVLRNPSIAGLLHRVKYIEKMGTGINKMRGLMAEAGLPPIVFEFGTFFTAIFRRPEVREAAELETSVEGMFSEKYIENFSVNFGVKGKQLKRMVSTIIRAARGKDLKIPELADEFNVTTRTLYEDMKKLQNWGILKFEGAPKTGRYILTEKGKMMIARVRE